jgi:hypothetical protein
LQLPSSLHAVAWLEPRHGHPSAGFPLQLTQSGAQVYMHVPLEQLTFSTKGRVLQFTQLAPHAPASVIWLTQAPLQISVPLGHVQMPATHVAPAGHAKVHVPQ